MICQRCKSERILRVNAKCSDLCAWKMATWKNWRSGYVPSKAGLGDDNDYVEFDVCLECGQMQGEYPNDFTKSKKDTE